MEAQAPPLLRCPISLELMEDPVTISTGVTYERKSIEKWLFTHKKSTCPATMQKLHNLDLIPNHTLKRLISSWKAQRQETLTLTLTLTPPQCNAFDHERLISLLSTVESSPFKVGSLKKLKSLIERSDELQSDFIRSGGVQLLSHVMSQTLAEKLSIDFTTFLACEEAVAVLDNLPESSVGFISNPECMNPIMVMLQRGSTEARLHAMSILLKVSKTNHDWCHQVSDDVFKSLLEMLSDEISTSKLSSSSLDVLIEIFDASKKSRIKAIEGGAICILIELLPESSRHSCEKILLLLKKLCDFPEGRSAFADHPLGVAAVTKKVLRVSEEATRLGVKIMWLICKFVPTEKVLDDMMVFGSVRKVLGLLHVDGRTSMKEKALKIMKMHGGVWRQYPCFPCELNQYLRLVR